MLQIQMLLQQKIFKQSFKHTHPLSKSCVAVVTLDCGRIPKALFSARWLKCSSVLGERKEPDETLTSNAAQVPHIPLSLSFVCLQCSIKKGILANGVFGSGFNGSWVKRVKDTNKGLETKRTVTITQSHNSVYQLFVPQYICILTSILFIYFSKQKLPLEVEASHKNLFNLTKNVRPLNILSII